MHFFLAQSIIICISIISAKEYYYHLIITTTIINYPMLYVNLKKEVLEIKKG